uniref:Uncharacterized protein n=1 Tax=Arundo donax TaxID=35708 RepID=A0A0A9GUH3_ARUDO
MTRKVAER